MLIKSIIGFVTGKYAFALSVGYKVIICALCVKNATDVATVNTALYSCAMLLLVDILWYGGIYALCTVKFSAMTVRIGRAVSLPMQIC